MRDLEVVPANEASWDDLQAVFGTSGDSARRWCQRYKMAAGESWESVGASPLAPRLLEIPASWLPAGVTVEQVASGLRPLLDKPVEFVLPTHGEPADRVALERALA
jgi:hypothetical protein